MRIKKLFVKNVRNIDKAELENLGDIVLIVGPNGCGKSSLFDAIKVFKSAYGAYSTYYGINLAQYPEFITLGQDSATIEIEIELANEEKDAIATEQSTLRGTVTVTRPMRAQPGGEHVQLLRKLFSAEARGAAKLGKVDHIPPDRKFNRGPVSGVSFDKASIEKEWQRIVDDTSHKFDDLKLDLWRMNYADMEATIKQTTPHPHYMERISHTFRDLLGDIEFIGVSGGLNEPPRFTIRTPRGEHGIDVLSSGQAEVLMIFAYLERRKFTNSVILFDGPELHLNAAIEKKIFGHFQRLAQQGNQFWVATHSPGIINSCDRETIYRLSGGSPNIATRVNTRDEQIKTLEALGATLSAQLISRRIVYVEGDSDKNILEEFQPGISHYVHFIPSGGVKPTGQVIDLLNKAVKFENFRAIRDRGFLTDAQIEKLERESNNHCVVWRRYEIENYLIDPVALFEVLQEYPALGCRDKFENATEIEEELKRIADGLQSQVVAKKLENELNSDLFKRRKINANAIEKSLETICARSLTKVQQLSQEENRRTLIEKTRSAIQREWGQKWVDLCPGKDVLREFCKKHVPGSTGTTFPLLIELLAKKVAQLECIHPDVQKVIDSIKA